MARGGHFTWRLTGRFSDLVDILPETEVRRALESVELSNFRYHRLPSVTPEALSDLLSGTAFAHKPVLLATPGPSHAREIAAVIDRGSFVAVEKPLATRKADLNWLAQRLPFELEKVFLLEKALPLTLLARRGRGTPAQLAGVTPLPWEELRQELGAVREIRGALVEGSDHRAWLRAKDSGGQTLETFSHLAALCCCSPRVASQPLSDRNQRSRCHRRRVPSCPKT